MMQIYGTVSSRAFRCLWLLEELGVPYEHIPVDFEVGSKQPEYLKLNPNGRVPCLRDGELVLFESLAINLYLARKHGGPLAGQGLADQARIYQWTLWATNEFEPHLSLLHRQWVRTSESERDTRAIDAAERALEAPLSVLSNELGEGDFLLREGFSLADLNVACVLGTAIPGRYSLEPFAQVKAWFGRCYARPAAQRVVAMMRAERKSGS